MKLSKTAANLLLVFVTILWEVPIFSIKWWLMPECNQEPSMRFVGAMCCGWRNHPLSPPTKTSYPV